MHTYILLHIKVHDKYMCVCMYVCWHVRTHIRACVYIYMHITHSTQPCALCMCWCVFTCSWEFVPRPPRCWHVWHLRDVLDRAVSFRVRTSTESRLIEGRSPRHDLSLLLRTTKAFSAHTYGQSCWRSWGFRPWVRPARGMYEPELYQVWIDY